MKTIKTLRVYLKQNQSCDRRHTVIISTIKNIDRVPYGRPQAMSLVFQDWQGQ